MTISRIPGSINYEVQIGSTVLVMTEPELRRLAALIRWVFNGN